MTVLQNIKNNLKILIITTYFFKRKIHKLVSHWVISFTLKKGKRIVKSCIKQQTYLWKKDTLFKDKNEVHTVISPPKHSAAIWDGSKGFTSESLNRNL